MPQTATAPAARTMKVSVTLSVEVDRDEWTAAYGADAAAAIRADVRRYVLDLVQQSAASESGAIPFVRLGMASGMRNRPSS